MLPLGLLGLASIVDLDPPGSVRLDSQVCIIVIICPSPELIGSEVEVRSIAEVCHRHSVGELAKMNQERRLEESTWRIAYLHTRISDEWLVQSGIRIISIDRIMLWLRKIDASLRALLSSIPRD